MKGKGKGERTSRHHDDCPLQFPNLRPADHVRLCPRYSAVVGRSEDDDCVGVEEIDSLQMELEILLASAAKRMRNIHNELTLLDEWIEKGTVTTLPTGKDKAIAAATASAAASQQAHASGESLASTSSVVSGGKRGSKGKAVEEKPAKRMRTDSGRATYAQPTPTKSKGKVQVSKGPSDGDSPASTSETPRHSESTVPPPPSGRVLLKNLTPSRFWAMVEPYCAEITPDDVKYLEEQIKACEDIGEYMKIPSLGRHYAEKWAEEDLVSERENSKVGDRRKSSSGLTNDTSDAASLMRRAEDSVEDDTSPFGPLTQRLVQGLLEENLITPLDDASLMSEADAVEAATISPRALAKQLQLGNTATLERRIRRELEDIGIFNSDDDKEEPGASSSDENDEILVELKKKQAELRALSHQNAIMLRHLHKQAKDELQSQELKKKMAAADSEVIEAYRKVQASKGKKKSPSKKEKEVFYKALKERDAIAKELQHHESQR